VSARISSNILNNPEAFSTTLYEKMKSINPGVEELELYEFRYGLETLLPRSGDWTSVVLDNQVEIEQRIHNPDFYRRIQLKPRLGERIVLDENIHRLANMLFTGLVKGQYTAEWVNAHFYFDIRGFFFLPRTVYFTPQVLAHLGGKPYKTFEQKQKRFEKVQDIGYKDFREANAEVDACFIEIVQQLIAVKGTPILLAIAGPTAAGKTEIVERLRTTFEGSGKKVSSIEMDNFLTDRDDREAKGIDSLGKKAIHFELFKRSLEAIVLGKPITIPRYDFVLATSSHDLSGNLKPGCTPLEIEPADIIFMEGNFTFLLKEVIDLIGIKVVYLTDDAIRLKRKWKRDMDYRKKYEPTYLRNRFFKDQFLMAQECFLPQLEICDLVVDTTGAALWASPKIANILVKILTSEMYFKNRINKSLS
jgi:uridine kinase